MKPIGFDSWRHYFNFVFAREFRNVDDNQIFAYSQTRMQKVGAILSKPIVSLTNYTLLNIRSPIVILSLTIVAIAGVSIMFYPAELVDFLSKIIPISHKVEPWMAKMILFLTVQTTILGVGLRAIGRLNNDELWAAWKTRQIYAVVLGAQLVQNAR